MQIKRVLEKKTTFFFQRKKDRKLSIVRKTFPSARGNESDPNGAFHSDCNLLEADLHQEVFCPLQGGSSMAISIIWPDMTHCTEPRISGNIWPLASQGQKVPFPSTERWGFTPAAWHCPKLNSQIWRMRGMLVICWLYEKGISGGHTRSVPLVT